MLGNSELGIAFPFVYVNDLWNMHNLGQQKFYFNATCFFYRKNIQITIIGSAFKFGFENSFLTGYR